MESTRDWCVVEHDNVIRVLGPIDVLTPDGPTAIGGHHARSLLAALVLGAGRSISIEQLERAIWGDDPPRSADSSLQTYVWRLRRLLGRDAIRRVDHSYSLAARRDQIDALQFEDLFAQATDAEPDPVACSRLCREALGLWRGVPFGDLADEEFFRLEAMRLDELRIATLRLLLEAQVHEGHLDPAIAELECVVREYPYREHLWHLLIDALRRDGRRTEALGACRRLRAALEEIDIEPGEELAAIEAEITSAA